MTTQPVTPGWVADDSTFGARLALIRQRMGWGNVREAALACGLPVESWRGWERDGRLPRDLITVGRAISTRTGCSLAWLVGMTDGGQDNSTATHRDANDAAGSTAWPTSRDAVIERYATCYPTKAA